MNKLHFRCLNDSSVILVTIILAGGRTFPYLKHLMENSLYRRQIASVQGYEIRDFSTQCRCWIHMAFGTF